MQGFNKVILMGNLSRDPVLLEGRLQVRKYINSNNEDRWTTEVVANSVRFLGSKKDRSGVTEGEFNIDETDAPF